TLLPRPPRMATVNPLIASGEPMSYWVWVTGEITQPASAPTPALSMKEAVTIQRTLIPQSRAAVRLAAQARMARPGSVNLKNTLRPATINAHTPSTQNTCGETCAPSSVTEETSVPVKN